MGVLIARAAAAHGPTIAALVALLTASASVDATKKPPVTPFCRILRSPGQSSVCVSSLHIDTFSGFDPFASFSSWNASPVSSPRVSKESSFLTSTRPPSSSASIFTSGPSCLRVYKASTASSRIPNLKCAPYELRLTSSIPPLLLSSFLNPVPASHVEWPELCNVRHRCFLPSCVCNRLRSIDTGCQSKASSFFESLRPVLSSSLLFRFQSPCSQSQASVLNVFNASLYFSNFSKFHHAWHSPSAASIADKNYGIQQEENGTTAVVLLGWLGAQQKHLRKYAQWYTSRGIHAISFVVPMRDLLTWKPGNKAEKHIDMLTHELTRWLKDEVEGGGRKYVIFHTFSNTGWLTYGAILERLLEQGDNLFDKIKGCVVDSAPAAKPDPQVWASGFSAALLKRQRVVAQHSMKIGADTVDKEQEPNRTENAIHAMLEKFFSVFLKLPYVNRRLSDITSILLQQQPSCPQLYIYSTADDVIPVESVESFIDEQRKSGRTIRACNFQKSPHVDHFRTFPDLYSDQLNRFLKQCMHEV